MSIPRSMTVTMSDPDTPPIEFELMGLSDGGFAYAGDIALSADEVLALGTALKRWEVAHFEGRDVTAMEHAEACSAASDCVIEIQED